MKMTGRMVSDQAGVEGDAVMGVAEVAGVGQAGAGQVGEVEVVHLLQGAAGQTGEGHLAGEAGVAAAGVAAGVAAAEAAAASVSHNQTHGQWLLCVCPGAQAVSELGCWPWHFILALFAYRLSCFFIFSLLSL